MAHACYKEQHLSLSISQDFPEAATMNSSIYIFAGTSVHSHTQHAYFTLKEFVYIFSWDLSIKHFNLFISCTLFLQPSINTTNIDTLLVATDQTERIVEPPENIQEKIAFIFNNLSQSNMTQKVSMLQQFTYTVSIIFVYYQCYLLLSLMSWGFFYFIFCILFNISLQKQKVIESKQRECAWLVQFSGLIDHELKTKGLSV